MPSKSVRWDDGEVVDNVIADLKFDDVPTECEGFPLKAAHERLIVKLPLAGRDSGGKFLNILEGGDVRAKMGGPNGTAIVQFGEHGRLVELGTYSLGRGVETSVDVP